LIALHIIAVVALMAIKFKVFALLNRYRNHTRE
jgi:hypothetical protein